MRLRRSRPQVSRVRLHQAERDALAHSGLLSRPDGALDAVVYFDDDRPDYAAVIPRRLARRLSRFLERAMDEIDALMVEDVNA